ALAGGGPEFVPAPVAGVAGGDGHGSGRYGIATDRRRRPRTSADLGWPCARYRRACNRRGLSPLAHLKAISRSPFDHARWASAPDYNGRVPQRMSQAPLPPASAAGTLPPESRFGLRPWSATGPLGELQSVAVDLSCQAPPSNGP